MWCVVNPFPRCSSCPVEAFGASHRVYFDTPPLKGLRLEPRRFHLRSDRKDGVSCTQAVFSGCK